MTAPVVTSETAPALMIVKTVLALVVTVTVRRRRTRSNAGPLRWETVPVRPRRPAWRPRGSDRSPGRGAVADASAAWRRVAGWLRGAAASAGAPAARDRRPLGAA